MVASAEVRIVPVIPTATYNPLEVVVVVVVAVESVDSSFSEQEMMGLFFRVLFFVCHSSQMF